MIFRVFDLETTGLPDQDKTTAVIQIGWTDLDFDEAGGAVRSIGDPVQFLVNPMRANPSLRIETGAKATHHIIEEDLVDAISVDEGFRHLASRPDAFACHNREHDGHYFTGAGRPIICTLKAAKVIWPDAERHSNQFLRYHLDLPVDRQLATPAHEAGPDSYVTAHILAAILATGATLSDLITWSTSASLMAKIPFGKHRGTRFEELPTDYLQWLRRQPGNDRDLRHTIQHHLDMRGAL